MVEIGTNVANTCVPTIRIRQLTFYLVHLGLLLEEMKYFGSGLCTFCNPPFSLSYSPTPEVTLILGSGVYSVLLFLCSFCIFVCPSNYIEIFSFWNLLLFLHCCFWDLPVNLSVRMWVYIGCSII